MPNISFSQQMFSAVTNMAEQYGAHCVDSKVSFNLKGNMTPFIFK